MINPAKNRGFLHGPGNNPVKTEPVRFWNMSRLSNHYEPFFLSKLGLLADYLFSLLWLPIVGQTVCTSGKVVLEDDDCTSLQLHYHRP